MTNPRMHGVCRNIELVETRLAGCDPASNSSVLGEQCYHQSTCVRSHARSYRGGLKQGIVQTLAPLCATSDGYPGNFGKATLGGAIPEMIANAVERSATYCLCQAQPLQNGHS